MEEDKSLEDVSLTPEEALDLLKRLTSSHTIPGRKIGELRKLITHYKKKSQKLPGPSFIGKRTLNLDTYDSIEKKRIALELPSFTESNNLSPLIFRKQKPPAQKPKIHRGRPITSPPVCKIADTSRVPKVSRVAKGFETYLELVGSLYYGHLPSSSAAREAETEEQEKEGFKFSVLDRMLSPMRVDLAFERWNPKEIVLFECGICKFGKDFEKIHEIVNEKLMCSWTLKAYQKS
eukprot:TRINITY_DN9800_c0_g1_i14.p1 TRINITY_DN9800_c0_g1~~TRINITY_DN9800_c0_g1_i14.p1  ORF type:complete len:234 (-),score=49.73 TRINITY_DN9800_c0_g1_i14:246-947(-)